LLNFDDASTGLTTGLKKSTSSTWLRSVCIARSPPRSAKLGSPVPTGPWRLPHLSHSAVRSAACWTTLSEPAGADGRVVVEVTSNTSDIAIRVIDDGPGLGNVPTNNSLGLTITRALVSACGGTFELKPGATGGMVAQIVLPATRNRSGSVMRLLLCDDHRPLLDALSMALRDRGHTVVATALDPDEAVEAARRHQPDACLLDVNFRHANGLNAIGRILEVSPDTKVVMLSGSISRSLMAEAIAKGAQGFVGKEKPVGAIIEALEMAHHGHLTAALP
jgi:CheY-like chemotaxis protein